jgi:hypothetical protein
MGLTKEKVPTLPAFIAKSVKRARAKAPPPPELDPVTVYLAAVYREVARWEQSASWAQMKDKIIAYYEANFDPRVKTGNFRFLIELSAGPHISLQEKSKYVMALEHARHRKVQADDFADFLQREGGIKACIKASRKGRSRRTRAE